MSDTLPDSPPLGRVVCLGCDMEADPATEILNIQPCVTHAARDGADDARVEYLHLSGTAEAGGEENSAMCRLLHGDRPHYDRYVRPVPR